ncbi:ee7573b5-9647-47f1-922f-e85d4b86edd8-CDS [Sclerotinia trifoliorum]|uniref:Ee7573b5-9647-47f1-922f-e85d4b86edd8-CDS n=1 Tax=Sclerotinia trifoliorum TaxID=28548 RepID=A0A8H2VL89_9HELO|nr:ee7573b5-9647-47f1-922f-e85d4b86edd8-CDS [Sclerotinia trifoliorum]
MGEPEKVVESPDVRSLADSSEMGESTKVPPSPSSSSLAESNSSGGSSLMKVSVDPKLLEDVAKQSATPVLRFYRFITSEYRLLFTIVFCLNLGGAVGFLYEWATNGTPSKTTAALATSINLVVAIVIREEHVINGLYTIFASAPKSFPLWIRRRMGKIYHLGGLHSGCASAATFWFILLSIETSWRGPYHAEKIILLIIIYILDILLISMIVMAHPSIRAKLHNSFEIIHRFAGWSALALLWTLTVLNSDVERSSTQKLTKVLLVNPNMWLLAVATWSIIMTWLNCRKVKVQSEQLSTHALRIYFDYVRPSPGTTIRISSSPLFEWHAFATVADPKKDGFSLIISNAGDWTKKLISEPPKEVWARRTPTCGVLRIAPMFRSILLVATGSGIAPCLPVILAQQTRINLFWSTRDPLTTYGDEIGGIIKALGPNAYIHNTTTMGRPATLPLVIQQYRDTESEAVIVISNPKLTIKLVQDLEYLGIPAFGPIWDS